MRYLLLVLYFFSAVSFAGHCSGAHKDDADRSADHDHAEETKESMKMEKDSKKTLSCSLWMPYGLKEEIIGTFFAFLYVIHANIFIVHYFL